MAILLLQHCLHWFHCCHEHDGGTRAARHAAVAAGTVCIEKQSCCLLLASIVAAIAADVVLIMSFFEFMKIVLPVTVAVAVTAVGSHYRR